MPVIYYFEIPALAGEYALGSASGSDGGYLLYLDISANAQFHENTLVKEKFTTKTTTARMNSQKYNKTACRQSFRQAVSRF